LVGGVMADASSALLREFFAQRRQQHRQRRLQRMPGPGATIDHIPVGDVQELHADAVQALPAEPKPDHS
jgi:hypothetical protein